jgi:hypothetical protein
LIVSAPGAEFRMRVLAGILVVLILLALDRAVTGGAAMALIFSALIFVADATFGGLMNLLR